LFIIFFCNKNINRVYFALPQLLSLSWKQWFSSFKNQRCTFTIFPLVSDWSDNVVLKEMPFLYPLCEHKVKFYHWKCRKRFPCCLDQLNFLKTILIIAIDDVCLRLFWYAHVTCYPEKLIAFCKQKMNTERVLAFFQS